MGINWGMMFFENTKELILWLIPIGLTLFLGLPSLIGWIKKKPQTSLLFKKVRGYNLFKNDVNRLNLEILYKGNVIENNLFLFQGELVNNGCLDIDKSHLHRKLKLTTKEGFIWKEVHLVNKENPMNASIQNNESSIEFGWELLKCKEKIVFEALIEYDKTFSSNQIESFYNSINFDFRITDLSSISKEISPQIKAQKNSFIWAIIVVILSVIGSCMILIIERRDVYYEIESSSSKYVTRIDAKDSLTIELKDIPSINNIAIKDFLKSYKISNIICKRDIIPIVLVIPVFMFYIVIGGIVIFCQYRKFRKKGRGSK